jgi:hypothetical protein
MAYAIGNPRPIPAQDIEEYQRRWQDRPRERYASTLEHPDWRYFKKLLRKK